MISQSRLFSVQQRKTTLNYWFGILRNKATPVEFLQSKKFEEPWDVELKLQSKSRYLLVQVTATFENL